MIKKKHYYQTSRYVSFKVIDAVVTPTLYLQPDVIYINGVSVNFTYSSNTVFLTDPISGTITLVIEKSGYDSDTSVRTYKTLNGNTISLTPIQQEGDGVCKVEWTQGDNKIDFDSHLLIYNGNTLLDEVYYSDKTYTDSNTDISLDHDDTGSGSQDFGGNETITIQPLYTGYKYIFVMLDYTNRSSSAATQLSSRNTVCKITIGPDTYTFNAPTGQSGQFWEVFSIENGVVTTINSITGTNTYGITV